MIEFIHLAPGVRLHGAFACAVVVVVVHCYGKVLMKFFVKYFFSTFCCLPFSFFLSLSFYLSRTLASICKRLLYPCCGFMFIASECNWHDAVCEQPFCFGRSRVSSLFIYSLCYFPQYSQFRWCFLSVLLTLAFLFFSSFLSIPLYSYLSLSPSLVQKKVHLHRAVRVFWSVELRYWYRSQEYKTFEKQTLSVCLPHRPL